MWSLLCIFLLRTVSTNKKGWSLPCNFWDICWLMYSKSSCIWRQRYFSCCKKVHDCVWCDIFPYDVRLCWYTHTCSYGTSDAGLLSCWFRWWRQEIGAGGAICVPGIEFWLHAKTYARLFPREGSLLFFAGPRVEGSTLIFGRFNDQNKRISRARGGAWPCLSNTCLRLWVYDI